MDLIVKLIRSVACLVAICGVTLTATAAPAKAVKAAAPSPAAITSSQAEEILAELREIKAMLEEDRKAAEPNNGGIRLPDVALHVLGSPNAPVTMVEFTDYQCPYCRRFHEQSWPELKKAYIDTGKVRFIVRDLPLDFHDQALPSAVAARCAGEQDRYWPMYEALLGQTEPLGKDTARKLAIATGVDLPTFDACVHNPGLRHAIETDIAEAQRIGVTGTPGFVIAQRKDGQLEGTLLLGAQPTAAFTTRIDALLTIR
jgi:protein-disulfide isomerase